MTTPDPSWPPTLALLKTDMGRELAEGEPPDDQDDAKLQLVLNAAVAVVQRLREGAYNFGRTGEETLAVPGDDMRLGTVRLAWRWHARRRSPDALVAMAELGSGRVPMFDSDIELMLEVGRFRPPVIAG